MTKTFIKQFRLTSGVTNGGNWHFQRSSAATPSVSRKGREKRRKGQRSLFKTQPLPPQAEVLQHTAIFPKTHCNCSGSTHYEFTIELSPLYIPRPFFPHHNVGASSEFQFVELALRNLVLQ